MHLTLRPFQTRFPFGSVPEELNLARYIRSPDHSTKGTISRFDALYVLVGAGFQVLFHSPPGVLFTFPSQYYSLSVTREYLGLEGGPPDFPRGFTCPAVLWILPAASLFRLRDSHALRSDFPFSSARVLQCFLQSVTPQRLLPVVWPLPRSLATTCGISVGFSSGGSPHIPMYSVYDDRSLLLPDCSIQTFTDQCLFAAPRNFSQLITSFFGSWCQGIRPVPFLA